MTGTAKISRALGAAILLLASCGLAAGQALNSGAKPLALNATLQESISLSLSAHAVNFTLFPGNATNAGSTSITATTRWTLTTARQRLNVYAFFSSSAAALTDGAGHNIPSSAFSISDNGAAFRTLVNTVPFGGANAGRRIARTRLNGGNQTGTRTDVMNFNIDLSPVGLRTLPTGTYTGTLTIQVQAI